MVYAVLLSGIFVACLFMPLGAGAKYGSLAVISFCGKERVKLVKLKLSKKTRFAERHSVWEKLMRKLAAEIRIFNRMNVMMPCRKGVAVLYIEALGQLYENPQWKCESVDGYEKLIYLLACVNLFALTDDETVRKQLLKNSLFMFGARTVLKKKTARTLRFLSRDLSPFVRCRFKFLQGETFSRFVGSALPFEVRNSASCEPVPLRSRYTASYIVHHGESVRIRHCVDEFLPVECFDILNTDGGGLRFTWKTGEDKMQFDLTHTADTFYWVNARAERAAAIYVRARNFTFGSSFAEPQVMLNVNINLSGVNGPDRVGAKIFVVYGSIKHEVTATVAKLKNVSGRINFLAADGKAAVIAEIEQLYERAYFSRFIKGEGLRKKHSAVLKHVPTLSLPTLVYTVETADDFFAVTDRFALYKKMAAACGSFNIVLVYSSQNDCCREIINAYVDRGEVRELVERGVFVFFVNKVTADAEVVYYLSKMAAHRGRAVGIKCLKNRAAEVTEHISNTYPITQSLFVRNTGGRAVSTAAEAYLRFSAPLNIVSKMNACLNAVALNNGRTGVYKLPAGSRVFDDCGAEIKEGDHITGGVVVRIDVRLAAFEERRFDIIRNDGAVSAADRKKAFIGALQNICVSAAEAQFMRLFSLPIVPEVCAAAFLTSVKSAIKTADRHLFYALLGKRETLPSEVYKLLVERVLGIKLVRGSIQLLPKAELTGGWTLDFVYQDKPYKFIVKQLPSGFSVRYGERESYNFLQVGV